MGKNDLVHFSIDVKESLFRVQAFASGIVAVIAHSPKFAVRDLVGSIDFVPDTMENSSLHLSINLASLEIMDEVKETERREIERVMFGEILEIAKYPKAEFKSSGVTSFKTGTNSYRTNLVGVLSLHGIAREMKLEAQVMAGKDTLKAQGFFSLMQSDFGLKIASVAGGIVKLKDELKCAYYIVAHRQN